MFSFILNKFHDFFEFYSSYYYLDYNNYNEYVYLSKTDNNANALSTTNNIFLDLFVNIGRDLSYDELCDYLDKCMKINPYKTIAIIFNCRDRKNGKKEKKISNDAMKWLKNNNWEKTYEGNIYTYIEKYGCWKDILTKKYVDIHDYDIELIANQLIKDKNNLINNKNISLCAKWAPSENKKYDKRNNITEKIGLKIYNILDKDNNLTDDINNKYIHKWKELYRKEYITPLRNKINSIENMMCKNKWNEIEYENVPAIASKKYKNCFMKHDESRYLEYLNNVVNGKSKINVTGILPHELVNYYLSDSTKEIDLTIESQWNTILLNTKSSGILDNILPIVDVSGSMFGAKNGSIPAQVSIALGLLISQCSTGNFKNKVISFSETPEEFLVKGNTLKEQIECIKNINWGYSTNFESIADIIINNSYTQDDIPDKIVVLSDMQFNEAIKIKDNDSDNDNNELLHSTFISKFINNNYNPPNIIYWNLNSDNTKSFPVDFKTNGTAIISGFSEQLLKIFLEYEVLNPEIILDKILEEYIKFVYVDKNEF
jgi:hypothetical protein|tara:strand:- start:2928 stop:4556 length:1629 start_codon:yes stop_codon:yes gene_type:complete